MATYLTFPQLQNIVPATITDFNNLTINPIIEEAFRTVNFSLPVSMQPILATQNFTGLPELEAFWVNYIQRWVAFQVAQDLFAFGNVKLTTDGARTFNDQFSQTSVPAEQNKANNYLNKLLTNNVNRALYYYQSVQYVFDGVAYPPTPNMQGFWNAAWSGLQYGYWSGFGWGWNGGSNGFFPYNYNTTPNLNWGVTIF